MKSGDFALDLAVDAERLRRLMAHFAGARAFLCCSTAGVYRDQGADHPARASNPLDDNHAAHWCGWMADLTGLEARFETSQRTVGPLPLDLALIHERIGPARMGWRDGIGRVLQARAPELDASPGGRAGRRAPR